MQDLPSYLGDAPKAEFARKVDISPAYLSQILSRKRTPSYEVAQRIETETGGAVPLASWVGWKPDQTKGSAA